MESPALRWYLVVGRWRTKDFLSRRRKLKSRYHTPKIVFSINTDFQCAIHIWWTHGPILKKDLLTFRIQNKKCRVGRAHNIFCCACACAHITLISHHGYCLPQFLLASHYCSLTSDWLALVVPTYTGPCCKTSGAAINRTGSKARNAPRTSEVMHFFAGMVEGMRWLERQRTWQK